MKFPKFYKYYLQTDIPNWKMLVLNTSWHCHHQCPLICLQWSEAQEITWKIERIRPRILWIPEERGQKFAGFWRFWWKWRVWGWGWRWWKRKKTQTTKEIGGEYMYSILYLVFSPRRKFHSNLPGANELTCCLVMPYGDINLGQHWLR